MTRIFVQTVGLNGFKRMTIIFQMVIGAMLAIMSGQICSHDSAAKRSILCPNDVNKKSGLAGSP